VIQSKLDMHTLIGAYLEANSEDSWLTLAAAEAEFEGFSSKHLRNFSDETEGATDQGDLQGLEGKPSIQLSA
jgi:hypothetical protein